MANTATRTTKNVKVAKVRITIDAETGEVLSASSWDRVTRFAHKETNGFRISDSLMAEKELPDDAERFAIIWEAE